jgi:hypothetical protein
MRCNQICDTNIQEVTEVPAHEKRNELMFLVIRRSLREKWGGGDEIA